MYCLYLSMFTTHVSIKVCFSKHLPCPICIICAPAPLYTYTPIHLCSCTLMYVLAYYFSCKIAPLYICTLAHICHHTFKCINIISCVHSCACCSCPSWPVSEAGQWDLVYERMIPILDHLLSNVSLQNNRVFSLSLSLSLRMCI